MLSYSPTTKTAFQAIIDKAFYEEYTNQYSMLEEQIKSQETKSYEVVNNFSSINMSSSDKLSIQVAGSQSLNEAIKLHYKILEQTKLLENNMTDDSQRQLLTNSNFENGGTITYTASVFRHFDVFSVNDYILFDDAIKVIKDTYLSSKELFYGALLVKENKPNFIINPLNHIVAQAVSKTKSPSGRFKIVFYFYKDKFKELDKKHEALFNDNLFDLYKTQALLELAILEEEPQYKIKINSIRSSRLNYNSKPEDITNISVSYSFVDKNNNEVTQNEEYYIQPTQIVNTGIVYPYYGSTIVKYTDNRYCYGFQLSPMLSCNVGFPIFENRDNSNLVISPASVCTGRLSNYSKAGRNSLNHANLNSPFFGYTLFLGAFTYARICAELALNIYAEKYGFEPIAELTFTPKPKRISFDEYKQQFNSESLADYIAYIKTINIQEFTHGS